MKCCTECKTLKPLEEYYLNSTKKGHAGICKQCAIQRSRLHQKADRYRYRHNQLWARYGISYDAYRLMLAEQGNCCAACGDAMDPDGKAPSVDHCHTSGAIRGIVCQPCNLAIGHAKDEPARLRAIADYLEKSLESE